MSEPFAATSIEVAVAELKAALGERASTGESLRDLHSGDESHHARRRPDVVVMAAEVAHVVETLRIASQHRVPVTPFGAGTGLEGAAVPARGGISLDTGGLDRILEIRPDDMIARVEAGVRRHALNAALRDTGLFFPVDPGADASIGGMVATGASGTNAVRFGTMRENVLGLTVVTAEGQVVRTGSLASKSSSGYDLTRLFVGSEGTLGVVTEATLRLHPIPDAVSAHAGFPTLDAAVAAVTDIRRSGLAIGRVELLDAPVAEVIARDRVMALDPSPTLFFEFHGVAGVSDLVSEIVAEHGGTPLVWARDPAAARLLWRVRHEILPRLRRARPGARAWPTDVCVPPSRLAEAILATRADVEASGVPGYIIGHVGDGNFHCCFMLLPGEEAEVKRLSDRIVARALKAGGTASGEHGVGLGKRDFQEREHGPEAVEMMRAIKAALDPLGILNPGKVLPDRYPAAAARREWNGELTR